MWHPLYTFTNNPVAPVVTSAQNSGGYETWNPAYLVNRRRRALERKKIPKVAKKAIEQVAELNLPIDEAEIALRLRTQSIEWSNQYLTFVRELQEALQQSLAYEQQKLNDRLMLGAIQAEIMRQEAITERNKRISIIMQLI